jgi:AcrR family transcriptional regulator
MVLEAATERFAEAGRAGTAIDDVARDSGVRKPAIYELFGSKDGLFRACVDAAVAQLGDHMREVNAETAALARPERIRRRLAATIDYADANRASFRLLVRAPYSWPNDDPGAGRALRSQLVGSMAEHYRQESIAAATPVDTAAEVLARLVFAMAEEVILLHDEDPTWDRDALVEFLAAFIEGGIAGAGIAAWTAAERAHPTR